MANNAGKSGAVGILRGIRDRFRIASDKTSYLHPAKSGIPQSQIPEVPTSNPETEFNTSYFKRKDLTLTPAEGEMADLETPLMKGDFSHHLPRPDWTEDEQAMDRVIHEFRMTGILTPVYKFEQKDTFETVHEIYGDDVIGEGVQDYYDLTPNMLNAREHTEEFRMSDTRSLKDYSSQGSTEKLAK